VADALDAAAVRAWLARFADVFGASREQLDDLDRQSGDGDFGSNLAVAIERTAADLAGDAADTPGAVFGIVARAFMHTGGTSGPLFGMWFAQLARAAGAAPEIGLAELAAGVDAGLQGIQRLGGAAPGDKTMVDALAPASSALSEAAEEGSTLRTGLAASAAAAREGADATTTLIARRGRASYVGEAARGVCDPGALTVALFFEASL
jgi:phosphoenolpyruvate---glycerone phosphotransferase subunit DhaL